MKPPYRLYGAELSPYSIKVRAYLRWKGIEHEWIPRSAARQAEFARYAKLPLIPLLVDANEQAMQDSTPIIAALEAAHPDPRLTPEDGALAFVAALIEDYADEWLNKAMFHYRWAYEADQASAARRIAALMVGEGGAALEASIRERMIGRLHFVGSTPETGPRIEASYLRLLAILEALLADRPYCLGGRPTLADFGLYGQLAELLSDPTPGALMRERAPRVAAWVEAMDRPAGRGPLETWAVLAPALAPLLGEIGRVYQPWMAANAAAVSAGAEIMNAEIEGAPFTQAPQKYAARAWGEIGRQRALIADPRLEDVLAAAGIQLS